MKPSILFVTTKLQHGVEIKNCMTRSKLHHRGLEETLVTSISLSFEAAHTGKCKLFFFRTLIVFTEQSTDAELEIDKKHALTVQ